MEVLIRYFGYGFHVHGEKYFLSEMQMLKADEINVHLKLCSNVLY